MNPPLPNYFLADLPPEATLSAAMLTEACQTLKRNRAQYLASRSTAEIAALLDALSREWLDPSFPFRRLALEHGPQELCYSSATLERGLDAFFKQLTGENLEALVEGELGHRSRLDDFAATPGEQCQRRSAIGRGPELIVHVAAGNVPCPALLSLVLGLLARSAQFMKCATGAALLPRLLAHSIYRMDAKLGACLEIAEWRGGTIQLEEALFSEAGCVTATGSDETLAALRRRLPEHARFLGYGHRVSFGFITKEAMNSFGLPRLVSDAASDVTAWNQLGCLSPHLFYVQPGGRAGPEQFAELLAVELEKREQIEPRGPIPAEIASLVAGRRALYEVRAAASDETRVWQSPGSTAWTVVFEADPRFQFSCLHRFVLVKPAANLIEALRAAECVRGKVSTVGVGAREDETPALAGELARWGATRICRIGQMQNPPLSWRHDGRPALADLITWTDWEQ